MCLMQSDNSGSTFHMLFILFSFCLGICQKNCYIITVNRKFIDKYSEKQIIFEVIRRGKEEKQKNSLADFMIFLCHNFLLVSVLYHCKIISCLDNTTHGMTFGDFAIGFTCFRPRKREVHRESNRKIS